MRKNIDKRFMFICLLALFQFLILSGQATPQKITTIPYQGIVNFIEGSNYSTMLFVSEVSFKSPTIEVTTDSLKIILITLSNSIDDTFEFRYFGGVYKANCSFEGNIIQGVEYKVMLQTINKWNNVIHAKINIDGNAFYPSSKKIKSVKYGLPNTKYDHQFTQYDYPNTEFILVTGLSVLFTANLLIDIRNISDQMDNVDNMADALGIKADYGNLNKDKNFKIMFAIASSAVTLFSFRHAIKRVPISVSYNIDTNTTGIFAQYKF